ncbi:hypothetical protein ACQ7DA_08510 [Zafaria sp. J156]|uniref:nucleotide-binding protein n=1 Tax=Zafaria sp. J156 TaxID=3116490 RepID=UPI002E7AA821|nr:hypothetical protein [Zafaria sp. J156]MEE1621238.1 hypothetical protein [Zafaria sp. J156]
MTTPQDPARPPVDPWAPQPQDDPWAPAPAPRRERRRRSAGQGTTPGPRPGAPSASPAASGFPTGFDDARADDGGLGAGSGAPGGLGTPLDGDKLRLASRAAGSRLLPRALKSMFTADTTASDLVAHAAQAQAPVTTGRRIAVVSTRGGAGKTTAAALLGRVYAAVRQDTAAVLDLDPGHGSLALRLGTTGGAAVDTLVEHATGGRLPTAADLSGLLAHAAPNLAASGPRGGLLGGAATPPASLREACAAVSRYFPVTLLDCPAGLAAPETQSALADGHAAVFVVPATLAGLDDAFTQLAAWRQTPQLARIPLSVLVLQADKASPLRALDQAGRISRLGFDAFAIGYDAHLAGGSLLSLPLLAPEHRAAAAALAGRVLEQANGRR